MQTDPTATNHLFHTRPLVRNTIIIQAKGIASIVGSHSSVGAAYSPYLQGSNLPQPQIFKGAGTGPPHSLRLHRHLYSKKRNLPQPSKLVSLFSCTYPATSRYILDTSTRGLYYLQSRVQYPYFFFESIRLSPERSLKI